MRKDERCSVNVPIEVYPACGQPRLLIKNFSVSGLRCVSPRKLPRGTLVEIDVAMAHPPSYFGEGVVVWCNEVDEHYELGIHFPNRMEVLAERIAIQLRQIENYRSLVRDVDNRLLSIEEAAHEWIREYAQRYPRISMEMITDYGVYEQVSSYHRQ